MFVGCKEPPPPLAPVAAAAGADEACAGCHPTEVAAWRASRHATAPGGPGCAACHGGPGTATLAAAPPAGAPPDGAAAPTAAAPPADAAHTGLGPVPAEACAACHTVSTEAPCASCHLPPDGAGKAGHGLAARFDEAGLSLGLKVVFEPGGPATGPLLRVTNQGAPHALPAGPGPALRLSIEQLGQDNTPREGTTRELRLGGEGPRLAPGASATLDYPVPIDERATSIRARVEAWPDEGHRAALEARLREPGLVGDERLATQAAFEATWSTRFTLWQLGLPVGDSPEPPATDPPKPGPPPGDAGATTPGDLARPGGAPPPPR